MTMRKHMIHGLVAVLAAGVPALAQSAAQLSPGQPQAPQKQGAPLVSGPAAPQEPPAPKKPVEEEKQSSPKKIVLGPSEARKLEVKHLPTKDDDIVVVRELRDVKEVLYNPDAVPHINCGPHIATSIFLPDGEQISAVIVGDTAHWDVTPVEGQNVLFIKPKQAGRYIETNCIVITAKRNVYNFGLMADPEERPLKTLRVMPPSWMNQDEEGNSMVVEPGSRSAINLLGAGGQAGRKLTPKDISDAEARARDEERVAQEEKQRQFILAMLAQRNDDYKVSYQWGCPFKVLNVFDASGVTWIRIEAPTGAQPVIYEIDENGNRAVLNFQPHTLDPNILMIDRRVRKAIVVMGKKEARITNVGLEKQISKLASSR